MRHIKEYDGLRGLMALWVLVGHWAATIYIQFPWPANLGNAYAVDVFVILSGFAIATLVERKRETYGIYITRRVLRIFPVYWFYLAISIALAWVSVDMWTNAAGGEATSNRLQISIAALDNFWPNVISHVVALHGAVPRNMVPNGEYAFLGQAWSISLEWQFYLIAPLVIALGVRAASSFKAGLVLVLGLFVLSYISPRFPYSFIGRYSAFFAIGIATYFLVNVGIPFLTQRRIVIAPIAMLIVTALILLQLPSVLPVSIWIVATASVLVPSQFGLSAIAGLLRWKPVQALGQMSYSVYLSHMAVLVLAMLVLEKAGITSTYLHAALLLIITLAGTLIISIASYNFIEVPFQRLGRNLATRPQAAE
ncbi:acyltransferase [Rhizobium sp. Pop5]|uniref:acyltransferase family protein n=1 Tax=Rhizobium sp. Pop5 TaxID=1223565 RepID=UPI000283CBC9|nr:acyltransferase [Rhizobium sp. Pop5]EJZ22460.1 acyltransferase [Rhizobium sp. Pop5]UVD57234.1 acyltransferase [Rhizobium sp. Pop5]